MSVTFRAQVIVPDTNSSARDVMMINPCFRNNVGLPGWDSTGLAKDLADGVAANIQTAGSTRPITVKLYDLHGTKPVYPFARYDRLPAGTIPTAQSPRELAVCLSFYATVNRPRRRGRLYLPYSWLTSASTAPNLISSTNIDAWINPWVTLFAGLGGADIDWVVFSKRDDDAFKVSTAWMDNEFDVIRGRGLKATYRKTVTTSG